MPSLPDILRANVVRLRETRGLKQREISAKSLAMVESGDRPWPRPETLEAIASDLGVTVIDLLVDWDKRHPALDDFLKSKGAKGIKPDEIAMLLRWIPMPGKEPTETTYVLLLQASRSMDDALPTVDDAPGGGDGN